MRYPNLIAICGKRRSGKDTIADILCEQYGYMKVRIADPLKFVVGTLFGFSLEQMECDQKDALDERWDISPRQAMQFIGTEVMQHKIQELLPDVGRKFWIRSFLSGIRGGDQNQKYVISDLRFLHEEEELRKHGVMIWKVIRPGHQHQHQHQHQNSEIDQHCSEKEWEEICEDVLIINSGDVSDLQKSVSDAMPRL